MFAWMVSIQNSKASTAKVRDPATSLMVGKGRIVGTSHMAATSRTDVTADRGHSAAETDTTPGIATLAGAGMTNEIAETAARIVTTPAVMTTTVMATEAVGMTTTGDPTLTDTGKIAVTVGEDGTAVPGSTAGTDVITGDVTAATDATPVRIVGIATAVTDGHGRIAAMGETHVTGEIHVTAGTRAIIETPATEVVRAAGAAEMTTPENPVTLVITG